MRLVVGVTGATGVEMSSRLLRALKLAGDCEIHLIVSEGARKTWQLESSVPPEALYHLADYIYEETDLAARVSSGSFVTDGMIVMPCSMKTLAGIASGYAENLIVRAADVCLKEGRKVVLVPREMPLGKTHLRNLQTAADCGCVIVPPMLTFYNGADTVEKQIDHIVGKVLLQFGIQSDGFVPWDGTGKCAQTGKSQGGCNWDRSRGMNNCGEGRSESRIESRSEDQSLIYREKLSFCTIQIQVTRAGSDFHMLLLGGDRPHIGCTVLAVPRPSLTGSGLGSCTSSVINITGHKDEQLCRYLAETIASQRQVTTVCTGGIHIEKITADQIRELETGVRRLAQQIISG